MTGPIRHCKKLAILAIFILLPLRAQTEHPVTGRRVAPVMGIAGAEWLDRPEREREEAPTEALNLMNVRPGMTVADVGAGTGYFTLRLAKQVGPTGKVYANDVQPEMLRRLEERAHAAGITNIVPILGTEGDPKLPANSVDLVLLVDVYHEFSRPQSMLDGIRQALKPDGRLVLLEYRKEDPTIPIRPEHKMSIAEVRAELEAQGFKMDKVLDTLPRQHLFFFVKATASSAAASRSR